MVATSWGFESLSGHQKNQKMIVANVLFSLKTTVIADAYFTLTQNGNVLLQHRFEREYPAPTRERHY